MSHCFLQKNINTFDVLKSIQIRTVLSENGHVVKKIELKLINNNSLQGGQQEYTSVVYYFEYQASFKLLSFVAFFNAKISSKQKSKSSKNKLTKQKQANKKQERRWLFSRAKLLRGGKSLACVFVCFCTFLFTRNLLVKKRKKFEIGLIPSKYHTTTYKFCNIHKCSKVTIWQ